MRARKTDPRTSHEAALSVKDDAGFYKTILVILKWPMTDEQMIAHYNALVLQGKAKPSSDSAMRTRRAKLVADGLVVPVGYGKTRFGRKTIIWQVKK
jgi:hypothetical protein